ncbi:hypothetical protein L6452_19418 [Arctium lappa]|uniref:Uncharacterized protein n=1 Tax=Arctium lappa TaxID=4217 RepID=A0ACB9B9X3_ARCLA|nr:hypothetical protein L6452_19418 [Arctium lappa]
MASHSSSSKNSNGSKKSNNSHHSMVQKADSDSVDQEHVLTSRMLSFTRHDYHLAQLNNKPNNHFVTLNPSGFPTEAAPLIQLLKNHFLVRALTLKRNDIPESYIQQFWLSARHVKMDKYGHCIIGYATHPSTEKILDLGINRRKLSDVFGLPTKTDLNLQKFSEEPTEEEILEFLRFIGYAVPITKRTNFRRQNLPPLWNVLFSILNRCLTSKVESPDQSSHTILAIMYGIYYDLPLDYAGLIFREIQNAVITKQQDQDRGTEPKNIVFGRFLGLLLGDDLIGEGKLPAEDKTIKLYEMKSHKPTTIKTGYPEARPLSTKMLTYLGSEEEAREYIRGNRTPEPRPVTPPRVGFQVGDIVVYLRDEEVRTEVQAAEVKKNETENPVVRGEGSERKKRKKNKKKRAAEAEDLTKPLQKARKTLVLAESPEDGPQSPTRIASAIAREVSLQFSEGLRETVAMELDDVTGRSQSDNEEVEPGKKSLEERNIKDAFGTPPKPTPSATHTSTPAVLVQRGIEIGPHSPNPAQTIRTEDIPSSSVPSSGETKTTSPSQKDESVALRVHLPQDTSLSHTEVFVTSVTHKNASSVEHRGLEGNPPELIIKTGSEGAKDSLAKSGTCVVPEVTSATFVTKDEFKAFADMVIKKLDELQSSISRESKANSEILVEALKANTEALQALSTNCAKRDDLQACGQAIIAHSHQIQVLGDLCTEEFPKYASTGVQTGVVEMGRLREEIKDITRNVMVPAHTQASTSAPDSSTFATKANLEAMGNLFLQDQKLLRSNFKDQGEKLSADLKRSIATFRFKSDIEINALSLAAEDAIKKITDHVNTNLCTPKKRKEPVSCQTQAGQKRAKHDDQDPDASGHGPHEGENLQSTKEAPISVSPLNQVPMSSEPEPQRSSKQKVSAAPSPTIIQIIESPPTAKDKGKAIATEPLKKVKSPPPTSEKLLKSSFDAFKRVKPEGEDSAFDLQPLSELPILQPLDTSSEDRVAEVIQGFERLRRPFPVPPKRDIEEEVYKYLYSRGAQDLPSVRLSEETISEERRRFYKDKAKPKSKVFSMAKITEVVAIKLGHTKCKNFWFSEYAVKREDTKIWTFTDADLPNLHPHDLPELFKWIEDNIADFQVALDLGVKKVNFPPPEDSLPPSANNLPNSITTSPSFGFVYLNLKGEKKLFIGMESQKYSTESLLLIQDLLIKHRSTPLVPAEAADILLTNIGATLNFRDLCICYYRELKKEGGFGKKINDFPDAKV